MKKELYKFRLVATSQAIINLMTDGTVDHIRYKIPVQRDSLRKWLWSRLEPQIISFIMIVCLSKIHSVILIRKIRVTIWSNLVFAIGCAFWWEERRRPLEDDFVIMEVGSWPEPKWLKSYFEIWFNWNRNFQILCAYHKSQGLDCPKTVQI